MDVSVSPLWHHACVSRRPGQESPCFLIRCPWGLRDPGPLNEASKLLPLDPTHSPARPRPYPRQTPLLSSATPVCLLPTLHPSSAVPPSSPQPTRSPGFCPRSPVSGKKVRDCGVNSSSSGGGGSLRGHRLSLCLENSPPFLSHLRSVFFS